MRRSRVTTPWVHNEDTTRDVIKRALELGINFIDTANVYSHGTSEEFIGRSLKNLGVPRDDVVLASKVYFNDGALSAEAIAREIDGSLTRLGTDYLEPSILITPPPLRTPWRHQIPWSRPGRYAP